MNKKVEYVLQDKLDVSKTWKDTFGNNEDRTLETLTKTMEFARQSNKTAQTGRIFRIIKRTITEEVIE